MQMQKFINFFDDLKILPRPMKVELILPFHMRVSLEVVNTSVKPLRRKRGRLVDLTTQFSDLQVEHILSLQSDSDGLNGVSFDIKLGQQNDLLFMSLLTCVRLEVLRLRIFRYEDESDNHPIVSLLATLIAGARKESCCLRYVVLDASNIKPVDVSHIPAIIEFVQTTKQLTKLLVINCTAELVKRKFWLQTQYVDVVFE